MTEGWENTQFSDNKTGRISETKDRTKFVTPPKKKNPLLKKSWLATCLFFNKSIFCVVFSFAQMCMMTLKLMQVAV